MKDFYVLFCKENCLWLFNFVGVCYWFIIGRKSLILKFFRILEYLNIKFF